MTMELYRRVVCQVRLCGIILTALSLDVTAAAADNCAGDIAGSVIGTFLVTLILCGLGYFLFRYYQKKKGKNRPLTLDSPDSEAGGRYVYDNPHFQDEEPEPANHRRSAATSLDAVERGEIGVDATKNNSTLENRNQGNAKLKKGKNAKSNILSGLKNGKAHRQRALDDSCINLGPEKIVVPLRGIDFTGLGFNICGNMRDGIFIKDVLHRGPAMESGKIKAGDRILSVTVSFTNMVYEDALTILSYASPYDVQLEIQKLADSGRLPGHQKKGSNASNASGFGGGYGSTADQLYHPLYRSQSIGDLSKIGRDEAGAKRSLSIGGPAVRMGVKKETLVKTSHSLREEGTVDVDTDKLSLGATPTTSSPDIGPAGKVSRFRVQKVAEVEDATAADRKATAMPAVSGDAKRKVSSSSSSSSFAEQQTVVPGSLPAAKNEEDDDHYLQPVQTANRYLVGETEVNFHAEDERSGGSPVAEMASLDLISLEVSDGHSGAPIPARRIPVPGKRKAPQPPALPDDYWTDSVQENVTVISTNRHHVTTLKVSPDIHQAADWVPAAVASQTHFSSESDTSLSDGDGGDGGATAAPLGARRRKSKDRRRRASSLGDLNHVEETAAPPKTFPFERSVSMDLAHALHAHGRTRPAVGSGGADLGIVDLSEDLSVVPAAGTLTKHFTARENLHLDNGDQRGWDALGDDLGLLSDTAKTNGADSSIIVHPDSTPRAEATTIPDDDAMSDVSLSDRETGERPKPVIRKMIAVDLSADDHYSYSSSSSSSSDQEEPEAPDSMSASYIHHDTVTGSSLVTIEATSPGAAIVAPPSQPSTTDPELAKIFNNVIVSNASKDPLGGDTVATDVKNGSGNANHSDDLLVRLEDPPLLEQPLQPPNGNGSVSPPMDRQYEPHLWQEVHDHRKFGVIGFDDSPPHSATVVQKVGSTDTGFTNFTVSEGALAHAVIITHPQLTAPATATTDHGLDRPPALQPPE